MITGVKCRSCAAEAVANRKSCAACLLKGREQSARHRRANPEAAKAAYRKWRAANIDAERARLRLYNAATKARRRRYDIENKVAQYARWRIWYEANKSALSLKQKSEDGRIKSRQRSALYRERYPDKRRASHAQYRVKYPERHAAKQRLRVANKLRATPPWVDKNAFLPLYEEAARRTRESGVRHHVDHIVVCGLHVPWNMQVIPAIDNLKKGNRLGPC